MKKCTLVGEGCDLSETGNLHAKTLLLLKPRGFCAGVVRAIDIVRIALEAFGRPIYVRKEIVHNRFVVEELQQKGAIFVDSVDEVPEGERVIYSAHGVSPEVRDASKVRKLRVIDATCPLVTKVHVEAVKVAKGGYSLSLIGHRDHDEVIGTLGEALAVMQVVGSTAEVASVTLPDPLDRLRNLSRKAAISHRPRRRLMQTERSAQAEVIGINETSVHFHL